MDRTSRVAVIIVNWNGREKFLTRCLSSLQRSLKSPDSIIFVDNGSTDGSVEYVRREFPGIQVIVNKKNEGFAAGNNRGIQLALKQHFEYCALLNYDTSVASDWLSELLACAQRYPTAGIWQSLLILGSDQGRLNSRGNALHLLGFGYCLGYREQVGEYHDVEVPYASGAAMLIHRRVFESIGLFDERLFLYQEDLDFCWRARLLGYRPWLAARSRVTHYYQFSRNPRKLFWMERNRGLVMLKNYHWGTLVLLTPLLLTVEFYLFFSALAGGWVLEKLRAWGSALRAFRTFLPTRHDIQVRRTIPDRAVLRFMRGTIVSEELPSPFLRFIANPLLELIRRGLCLVVWW